jgi:hypothetical protein
MSQKLFIKDNTEKKVYIYSYAKKIKFLKRIHNLIIMRSRQVFCITNPNKLLPEFLTKSHLHYDVHSE